MSWFQYRREQPDAVARLFCLPFAGGTALSYRSWVSAAPSDLEVWPIQLPGRESRIAEPAIVRMPALVEALAEAMMPHLDLPYGLFGHSLGARVGYELVQALRRRGAPEPQHLFVSGSRAPDVPAVGPTVHRLSDADLVEELRRLGGTPDDVLDNADLMGLLLPIVRADFELLETYRFEDTSPLRCDITAFRGVSDPQASRADTEGWSRLTTGRFVHKTYAGNHFFITAHARALLNEAAVRLFASMRTVPA